MARVLANLTLIVGLASAGLAAGAAAPTNPAHPTTPAPAATPASPDSTQLRRIVAGHVTRDARGMFGTFRLESAPAGGRHAGVASDGTGGACLLFSASREGGANCHADADCASLAAAPGDGGYCVAAPGSAGGHCWLRPAESAAVPYCMRSRRDPLPLGAAVAFPRDDRGTLPVANPARGWWRVHACLNRVPAGCAAAASDSKQTDDGLPFHVR